MHGVLVVPDRRLHGTGYFNMGQEEKLDPETLDLVNRASVDQLVAIGRAVDAAYVLSSRPFGRLASRIMVPIMRGLEAVLEVSSFFGVPTDPKISNARSMAGEITSKIVVMESELSKAGDILKSIAKSIADKDPNIKSITYRNPNGVVEMLILPRDTGIDLSLISGNDLASVKKAADDGKKALEELGKEVRLGWILAVVIIASALSAVFLTLKSLISEFAEGKKSAIERVAERMREITDEMSRIDASIVSIKHRINEIKDIAKVRKLTPEEERFLKSYEGELKKLEERKEGLNKEREFISRNEDKIRDADTVLGEVERVIQAGVSLITYAMIGAAAFFIVGTVIHFVTR